MLNYPEVKFLLTILKHDDSSKLKHELGRLDLKDLDWELLTRSTLLPIFYKKTKNFYREINVPENVFDIWKHRHFLMEVLNKIRMKALKEVAIEFKRSGIVFLVMKGAAELLTVYRDDYGMRPMGDIDILIKRSDLPTAEEILIRLGYSLKTYSEAGRDKAAKLGREKNYIKKHAIAPIILDLHWEVISFATGTISHIGEMLTVSYFENTATAQDDIIDIPVPDPTNIILTSALHGIKDFHYLTTTGLCWHINSVRDIYKVEFYCLMHYLVLAYRIKVLSRFNGLKVKWDDFFDKTRPMKDDPRFKQLLAACRLCGIENGLENAYRESGIPPVISEKYWRTLTRRSDRFFILDTMRNMRRDDISIRVMAAYLFTYIFGLRSLAMAKGLRGYLSKRIKP